MTALLCAVFFVSGASALVFESLWFHQAGLAFGSSVWASSLVLSGFMAGLAVGSAIAFRRGHRVGAPVRTYALLECAIAVSGVTLVYGLPSLGAWLTPLLGPLADVPWALNAMRLLVAFAVLVVPSTAMGLTLPLLTRALVASDPNFGQALGRLYGWNTLGAVAGAVLAETYLVRVFGVRGSALVAGGLNLTAASVAAFVIARALDPGGNEASDREAGAGLAWVRTGRPWLAAAFLSGFLLLALEVVWFRFLLLYVMGSSLSFAVMLAVVLAGIGLGGLVAGAWLRRDPSAFRHAVFVAVAAGAACVASYAAFDEVAAPFGDAVIRGFGPVLLVSLPLMLPVSVLSGVFFTLAGAGLHGGSAPASGAAGLLTLANTTGAALGAFTGGFVLLPGLGMEASFFLIALAYGGVALLAHAPAPLPRRLRLGVLVAFVATLALFPFGSMLRSHLLTAAGRWSGARPWRVVALQEGLSETVMYVEEDIYGQPNDLRLVTNSLSMSSNEFHSRRYMKLYVYLPAAVHPALRSALLISYGVGSTAKALTDTDAFERIDVVDISREVLGLSPVVFPDPREDPLLDPRVSVHVEDGRYFLQTTERTFDLITSEPPPPQIANVVNLYTREYFQAMRDRLNDGGFVTYWLPLHSLSDPSARAVTAAFRAVFPDASLWHAWGEDVMMVGSHGASGPVSAQHFARQWSDPGVAPELEALGLEDPGQLGALFIGEGDHLDRLVAGERPLTDDFPKRILPGRPLAPRSSGFYWELLDAREARERFASSDVAARLWPPDMIEQTLPFFEIQAALHDLTDLSVHPLAKDVAAFHGIVTGTDLRAPVLWHMGSTSDLQRTLDALPNEVREEPIWQYQLGARRIAERRFEEALGPLAGAERDPAQRPVARMFRIYAAAMAGRVDEAAELARDARAGLGDGAPLGAWWAFLEDALGVQSAGD